MSDRQFASETHFPNLPEEVINRILLFCDPEDIYFNVQSVCQRLRRLAGEPLLWRHYCYTEFRYWDARHCIQEKFIGPIGLEDWKGLYCYRRRIDLKITQLLNSILSTQVSRISKYEAIARFGYDAKDTLLRHIRIDENFHDALARRYYANSVLDYVHRAKALEEWHGILNNKNVPLERALGSFDMFVLHDRYGDIFEISETFDKITECFRLEYPDVDNLSTRAKALAIIAFMRKQNLTGSISDLAYRNLQNSFIGFYLQNPEYPPIPLISVAIFCAIGQRIGLDARGCGTPIYVYVIVIPKPGETIDAKKLGEGEPDGEPMYLDPYRSMEEVLLQTLIKTLCEWGLNQSHHFEFLSDMSLESMILRMSKTILNTVRHFRVHHEDYRIYGHAVMRLQNSSITDLEKAHYSALWARFMFSGHSKQLTPETSQSQLIPIMLERYERLYPMDGVFIDKYILPLYSDPQNPTNSQIVQALRAVRTADQTPKQVRLRLHPADRKVRYKVGQVFRHRRYYYTAVIFGWDLEGGPNFDWVVSSDVDSLPSGRYQSFYHALVEDTSIRYVAEENIEIIEPEFPLALMSLAGKYFKRWDVESHTFVSGIRDEYPDD